ncbi:hypothetical protein [uncultured Endozoicomonas sp.]|uniref:hypothetical protein n=1 Tax=uncultured Endozoicomonas sp. TaxID=432652 RepID=UPI002608C9F1|nr:hypothetical protein [uncultured Endozoicomonas sp.]
MIKLKFNNKTVMVKTHPEDETLYCLNDIHKASGGEKKYTPSQFSRNAYLHSVSFSPKGTRASYIYTDEKTVYKYAAWIDDTFYDTVFEAFKAAANGKSTEASTIANSVAVPEALITETKETEARLSYHIDKAGKRGLINIKHPHSQFKRQAMKVATGYGHKQLTNKTATGIEYLVEAEHTAAISAYKASLEIIIKLLVSGVTDYHTISMILGVETGKNKDLIKEAA